MITNVLRGDDERVNEVYRKFDVGSKGFLTRAEFIKAVKDMNDIAPPDDAIAEIPTKVPRATFLRAVHHYKGSVKIVGVARRVHSMVGS
jgi:hypothetical protein